MPLKRELEVTEEDNSADEKPTLDLDPDLSNEGPTTLTKPTKTKSPNTPKTPKASPKKARSTPATPSSSTSNSNGNVNGNEPLSARALYAVMIIDKGIEALSKPEVESATGLTANQQRDMTRKDHKGGLRKALIAIAEKL
ncbi:hypothetical protein IAU59_000621 [Kwoniella sp. CBS 9459]